MELEEGLTYDDVLIKQRKSRIESRSDVDTASEVIKGIVVDKPVISANMDTVTEAEMAQAMYDNGGLGIVHRFMSLESQIEELEKVDGVVGGSVGVSDAAVGNAGKLMSAGADFITVDIAHGHMNKMINTIEKLKEEYPDIKIVAGNIGTEQGAKDLFRAGADTIKVGIGPGSLCTTRVQAGVGIPQWTAVKKAVDAKKELEEDEEHIFGDKTLRIIADGGIKRPGDMAKALGVGADAVMIGGLFAPCPESASPETDDGKKVARGLASESARADNDMDTSKPIEGGEVEVSSGKPVEVILKRLCNGVRSSFSYSGAKNIVEFQKRARFIRVTPTAMQRNEVHLESKNDIHKDKYEQE